MMSKSLYLHVETDRLLEALAHAHIFGGMPPPAVNPRCCTVDCDGRQKISGAARRKDDLGDVVTLDHKAAVVGAAPSCDNVQHRCGQPILKGAPVLWTRNPTQPDQRCVAARRRPSRH